MQYFPAGKCLDCLFASDGDQCETCLQGYVLSEDGRCVHARLSTSPGYNMELDNGMTSSPTKPTRGSITPDKVIVAQC